VDVSVGPSVSHVALAVGAYLAPLGVPYLPAGPAPGSILKNERAFISFGSQEGLTFPLGVYAYEAGYRKATMLIADYEEGYSFCGHFKKGFVQSGGAVIQEQLVDPYAGDIASYLVNIDKKADFIGFWLVGLASLTLPKRVKEYGLNLPLFFMMSLPVEESVLPQLGDDALGMKSLALYTSLIDTPINKRFVAEYRAKYDEYPIGGYTQEGYVGISVFLEAVRATGGDTTPEKIVEALKTVSVVTPGGIVKMTPERSAISDFYIVEAVKVDGRYAWKPLKKIRR
jgi:branched-chain amino acid transport system substrate-binding protein